MSEIADLFAEQLRQTCRLTGARWAVWLRRGSSDWSFGVGYALNKAREASLGQLIQQPDVAAWLAGALSSGRTRSRSCRTLGTVLNCERIYVFANPMAQSAILVGAGQLQADAQAFFRILALSRPEEAASPEISILDPLSSSATEIGQGVTYNPQTVLTWLLETLAGLVPCKGVYIAIRSGDFLRVQAVAGGYHPGARGLSITIQEDPLLAGVVASRQGVIVADIKDSSRSVIRESLPKPVKSYMILPVNIGRRVIGVVTFASYEPDAFSRADLRAAENFLERAAHAVENFIVFQDISGYLKQFALINELSSAAATCSDVSEVARRIVLRLRRTFHTEQVAVLLVSPDRNMLKEYGAEPGVPPLLIPVETSLAGYTVETGLPVRTGDVRTAPRFQAEPLQIRSVISAPLIFRGQVLGAILVESEKSNAFSSDDGQLLSVIAGHLAGLVDNVRLHEETRERARNLDLIHRVVQKVVGLTGIDQLAQETAGLMADYFNYEFAVVILVDESGQKLVFTGVGGTMSHLIRAGDSYPVERGLTGRAIRTGLSFFTNDISQEPDYYPLAGWYAGSEMCVPLREGDRIFGVINLERAQKQAFTENDLLLVESLAGILSSVMMNAKRHQELNIRVSHLNVVRETALDISGDLDRSKLLQRIHARIVAMMRCSESVIGLIDEKEEVVRFIEPTGRWFDLNAEIPYWEGVIGRVAATGKTLIIPDYSSWSGKLRAPQLQNLATAAGVPLNWMGQVMGVLVIADDQPGRVFTEDEIQLLELLAPQVAISIRNAQLYKELGERIEAQRRAESQLLRSARLAALGEMAAGVAHELNNPLTTVAGFVELILEELPKDLPQREELELVLAEARRAHTVVRRMLDFARQSEFMRSQVAMNNLVEETIALIQHQVQSSGVLIHNDLENGLPEIYADPNQMKQVILNLIQNALQAMPEGGELFIESRRQSNSGNDGVALAFRDNGEGIPANIIDRLFEPFFTTRPVGKGTGLGLSVIYGIVTDHGGHIDVESQPGQGSCFTVWLPVEARERHV